jgi:hypothetical protein
VATVPTDRPIFVVGCPRSGTTLLTLMLHAHSRIAVPPETRFLVQAFRAQRRFGDLSRPEGRARLARFVVDRRRSKTADLRLDRDVLRSAVTKAPPTLGSALGAVYRSYAAAQGKPRWGDKRPVYFQSVDAIRALFPDAQFVHLVRDGRDCMASLKRMPWWHRDAVESLALWTQAVDYGERAARRLPAGTWPQLRYEDLVTDPRAALESLCAFLGEAFEDAMLEPHRVAEQVPDRKSWHAATRSAVTADRVGAHLDGLDPWEAALAHVVAGRRLRRLGYEAPVRAVPPPLPVLARYAWVTARRRLGGRRRTARDRRLVRSAGPLADLGAVAGHGALR